MKEISGIKSIDFKIDASGYGAVNWNGSISLYNKEIGKQIDNHSIPKLRGYTNLTGETITKDGKTFEGKKGPYDFNFKETPLYISQNCIRHHLFREQSYDLQQVKKNDPLEILASLTGLIRGYAITESQSKRTSPLLLEDFIDTLANGNFEQMGRCGSKDDGKKAQEEKNQSEDKEKEKKKVIKSTSVFSKTTFGKTQYESYGCINIEQLQFISLDKKFDRPALIIQESGCEKIRNMVQEFIQSLDSNRNPKVIFHGNYCRKGCIYQQGEAGLLLDNVAIDILVNKTLDLIKKLTIIQAKGYMHVDNITVDYNDSNRFMRIKRDGNNIQYSPKSPEYAVYYEAL